MYLGTYLTDRLFILTNFVYNIGELVITIYYSLAVTLRTKGGHLLLMSALLLLRAEAKRNKRTTYKFILLPRLSMLH
ncbi:hypothetical protein C5L34_002673 [Lentilactobacillus hilgardii]|nr:hypothetical protein C5L34_002673 [Lentilactobacillus hilgardii]